MNLLIDFGNSRCKWCLSDGAALHRFDSIEYAESGIDQRVDQCVQALQNIEVKQIHAVSVLGVEFNQALTHQSLQSLGSAITFHSAQKKRYGVSLKYSDVTSYGDDRYAALIASHQHFSGDKIVVDCGTATTIDVIDALGSHQGGLIMPGVHLMLDSLVNKASGIDFHDTPRSVNLLCDNTQDAVYSGCVNQFQKAVLGVIEQLTHSKAYMIVLTGGNCELLDMTKIGNAEYAIQPHLVLQGLQLMQD